MATVPLQSALIVFDPARAVEDARSRKVVVKGLIDTQVLRPGVDYGSVPGTDKPTLFKPGAERLCSAFGLDPRFETITAIEGWDGDEPLFFYRIRCSLVHIETGREIATGIGSCNSRESRYRWRWVDADKAPAHLDRGTLERRSSTISEFTFAVDKKETGGQYGKPAAYWQAFDEAIASGRARRIKKTTAKGAEYDAWEIASVQYRVPNDDIFSLVNTIDKMACKRALVAAALIGANASEFFTQDVEDMPGFGLDDHSVPARADVVDGVVEVIDTGAPVPWTANEAKAWEQSTRINKSLTMQDILLALGVTRLGEWKKDAAAANDAVDAYIEDQIAKSATAKSAGAATRASVLETEPNGAIEMRHIPDEVMEDIVYGSEVESNDGMC
jgi:hypothetical protein